MKGMPLAALGSLSSFDFGPPWPVLLHLALAAGYWLRRQSQGHHLVYLSGLARKPDEEEIPAVIDFKGSKLVSSEKAPREACV